MGYSIRHSAANRELMVMTPEENDVWDALAEAGYEYVSFVAPNAEDKPTHLDFTPTLHLFETYRRYIRRKGAPGDEELNIQQFGVAFNNVTENTLQRCLRRVNISGVRKRMWGYRGVKGPRSHRIKRSPGRPRL